MIPLDDFATDLQPVGFLHIDTEGWDARCLLGAQKILRDPINCTYIIAEAWDTVTSKLNGFSASPEGDISAAMKKHTSFARQRNIVDTETNVVYYPARQLEKMKQLRKLISHQLLK